MGSQVFLSVAPAGGGVVVTTSSLPAGQVGSPYSVQLAATGGTPPYRWSGTGIPPGLSLSTSGLLSGTPTTSGSFTPSFTAFDSLNFPSAPAVPALSVSAASGAFIPQPGFSFSGSVGFDQPFTIMNASNPFGPTGPTLIMFDDFRGGTPGAAVAAGAAGVSGSETWSNGGDSGYSGNPVYVAGNRSGSGNCIRIRTNGDGDASWEGLSLLFPSTTGIYIFWAENSNGTDYNALTGAGTGNAWNYKINWFQNNGFTGGAFEEILYGIHFANPGTSAGFGTNDPTFLPSWDIGSGIVFDPNNWNSVETGYVGDPNNPTTAPGLMFVFTYNPQNKALIGQGRRGGSNNTLVLFNSAVGANGSYASGNTLRMPGLVQGAPSSLVMYRADVYVAIGPHAFNRFFVGDASTAIQCETIMPCTIDSWSAGAVTMRPRQGAFTQLAGNYLYGSWDGANTIVPIGQFTPPIVFDFFISTTGSDANNGLTPATAWPITALNTKQSTYAGKKIGIIAGTYDVSSLMGTFHSPALSINGGTVSSPTYIASCDTSGNYSPRAATLDAKGASGFFGGGNSNLSTIMGNSTPQGTGSQPTPANWGNYTIDGLRFTGFSLWALQVGSLDGSGPGPTPNVTIKNCEVFGGNAASAPFSGVHIGPFEFYYYSNLLVDNCYIHDFSAVGANSTHCQAMTVWGVNAPATAPSIGLTVQRCTFVNAGGIFGIEDVGFSSSTTVQQCYFDMTTGQSSAVPNGLAIMGFGRAGTGATGCIFRNNIVKGGAPFDGFGASETWWAEPVQYSNNTWDLAAGAGFPGVGVRVVEPAGFTGFVSCFNNLFWDNGASNLNTYGYNSGNVDVFALCDYNIYGTINRFTTFPANGGTPSSTTAQTFATWKTAIGNKEAHSSTNSTNPFTNNGSRALAYQVTAGVAFGTGKVGGVSTGAACNVGAWDGTVTQIGSVLNGVVD